MQQLSKNEIRILMLLFIAIFVIGTTVGFVLGTVYTEGKSKEFINSVSESNENKVQIGSNVYTISKDRIIEPDLQNYNLSTYSWYKNNETVNTTFITNYSEDNQSFVNECINEDGTLNYSKCTFIFQ